MRKKFAVYKKPSICIGSFKEEYEPFRVRIICEAEGWSMVRREGAMPFVVRTQELVAEEKANP